MSFIQTLTDSAITLIPYMLILIALLACTRKILSKGDASRFRVILVLLLTPHLLVWLPNYVYQWSLLELDYSFATSMGISILVDCSVEDQSYIEDCEVCCRPINLWIHIDLNQDIQITVQHENE